MITLYGIPTCESCRKARKALEASGQGVRFRDVRAEPLSPEEIARFLAAFGDRLVNRASATWRGLDEAARSGPPATLVAAHPTLMKRPVIDADGRLELGWSKEVAARLS